MHSTARVLHVCLPSALALSEYSLTSGSNGFLEGKAPCLIDVFLFHALLTGAQFTGCFTSLCDLVIFTNLQCSMLNVSIKVNAAIFLTTA